VSAGTEIEEAAESIDAVARCCEPLKKPNHVQNLCNSFAEGMKRETCKNI
jgi:hypothetical protein